MKINNVRARQRQQASQVLRGGSQVMKESSKGVGSGELALEDMISHDRTL